VCKPHTEHENHLQDLGGNRGLLRLHSILYLLHLLRRFACSVAEPKKYKRSSNDAERKKMAQTDMSPRKPLGKLVYLFFYCLWLGFCDCGCHGVKNLLENVCEHKTMIYAMMRRGGEKWSGVE
jgi:hypothetical protein